MSQNKNSASTVGRSATRDYSELGAQLAALVPGDQIVIRKHCVLIVSSHGTTHS